ncbi:polysaccharide lyase 6 family protein [Paenibacillus sp. GD4]|uniref:polysaccharide lyase 6 family protein n=1 Tax=Paenibacillus sp. GD4 TaxID=3068890 RepID=UPI002796C9CC|nr:polysaccharide lyase 6 family protein [Paenibacillus sp. GD4]MDQ1912595.1 polysaccharide lyase 6 family protein [Paenibacillus sp. GD4]
MNRKKFLAVIQLLCMATVALPNAGYAADGAAASSVTASTVVNVSTTAELVSAINAASAGTTIVLADGTYTHTGSFPITDKHGTASNPITIRAANQGQVVMTGRAGFNISNSSYIVIQGMKFTGTATAVNMNSSHHIRVTRNTFALGAGNNIKWVQFSGNNSHHNRIDHNEFGPRVDLGQMIAFQSSVMSQYDVIEYNYFHDAAHQTVNGGETIRVGLSGSSMTNGYTTIQYNLFENLDSDPEIISVKSGQNTVRFNTFINNRGQVTARHGHGNSYYGNYFFRTVDKPGVGGLRIYGNDHKIYNNYFENIDSTIHIDGANYDAGPDGSNYDSSVLTRHWRVYRAQVFHNTIVNSSSGIVVGKSYTYGPVDSVVANNLVIGSGGPLYNEVKGDNIRYEGNIGFGGTLSNLPRSSSEIKEADPLLQPVNGLYRLSADSPAIDAAAGDYPVIDDMDGQLRGRADVGADELETGLVLRKPLTPAEVGPNARMAMTSRAVGTHTGNGWYSSDVSVQLGVVNAEEGAGQIEFRLGSQTSWQPLPAEAIRFTEEGEHVLRYRYAGEGVPEQEQKLGIRIDKTAPAYRLLANGQPMAEEAVYPDTSTLALKLQGEDSLSGVARQSLTVSGATYEREASVPLAGKLGEQAVHVLIEDAAGNVTEAVHWYKVIPTLETLLSVADSYIASGEVSGPLVMQTLNRLKQASHHLDKDAEAKQQAIHFLGKLIQAAQQPPQEAMISSPARQYITAYSRALIEQLTS